MKKILTILALGAAITATAQSAVDTYQVSQPDFKGTARFMSMGGAFTALGGDISSLSQNPAGIGVYRSSEIGITMDINMQNTATSPAYNQFNPSTASQTKVYLNSFGYVGSINLDGAMKTFNWGVSYSRAAAFDRLYSGYIADPSGSLSDYVAGFTNGTPYEGSNGLHSYTGYDPYDNVNLDWFSILAYDSYIINPTSADTYIGLEGTAGDALYNVREKGGIDQYDITFGGNVENVVNWGVGIGITDLKYTRYAFYSESIENATLASGNYGSAQFDLDNWKNINGTGWNMKFGVIVKPINEFRIGLAIHTPTWYKFDQSYNAYCDYDYYDPSLPDGRDNPYKGTANTPDAYFSWRLNSPWRLMAGVAGVIGSKAIVSADYQYDAYGSMSMKVPSGGGIYADFVPEYGVNDAIKDTYRSASTLRIGAEYRVTPQFSVRAGYNYQTSTATTAAYNGTLQDVNTSGTDPSFSFDNNTQYITLGLGYKYKHWYIDAAYVHKHRESRYYAFTSYSGLMGPNSKLVDNNNSIVLSTGFKF